MTDYDAEIERLNQRLRELGRKIDEAKARELSARMEANAYQIEYYKQSGIISELMNERNKEIEARSDEIMRRLRELRDDR